MQIIILDYSKKTMTLKGNNVGETKYSPTKNEEIKLCISEISPINERSLVGNICRVMTNLYAQVCKLKLKFLYLVEN